MPETLDSPIQTTRSAIDFLWMPPVRVLFRNDGTQIIRRCKCLWSQHQDFETDMLGDSRYVSGTMLSRNLPEQDPEYPGFYVDDMELVDGGGYAARKDSGGIPGGTSKVTAYWDSGELDSSNKPTSGLAIYQVTMRRPLYQLLSDEDAAADALLEQSRFTFVRKVPSVEALQIPVNTLCFADDPEHKPIQAGAPKLFPTVGIQYTWFEVPADDGYPELTAEGMAGKVNSATFLNRPAGTLLLLAPEITPYQSRVGRTLLNVQYNLLYRNNGTARDGQPAGWNYFYDPPTDAYRKMVRIRDTSKPLFDSDDFAKLFDPSNG